MPSYLLVVGDFNYPNIDWINGCLSKPDHNEQLFYDTLQDCVLHQLVNQLTRIRPGTNPHILDLILTNEEATVWSKILVILQVLGVVTVLVFISI